METRDSRSVRERHKTASNAVNAPTPSPAAALLREGLARHQARDFQQAAAFYRQVLQIAPEHPDAFHLLGLIAHEEGKHDLAIRLYDLAIGFNPKYEVYFNNRGNTYRSLENYLAALENYDQAIALNPSYAKAYCNRGAVLNELDRYEEALESYDKALALLPGFADAHSGRACSLRHLERSDDALASYDEAIRLNEKFADAYLNRGHLLNQLSRHEDALADYDKCLALKPGQAEAYFGRGIALRRLHRFPEAFESLHEVCRLNPARADVHNEIGTLYNELRNFDAAAMSFDRATAIDPDYAVAHTNAGIAHLEAGRYQKSLESFDKAIALDSENLFVEGIRIHVRRQLCDWSTAQQDEQEIEDRLQRGEVFLSPFCILSISDSPSLQRRAAQVFYKELSEPAPDIRFLPRDPGRKKIRVGYFSSDFRHHPVSYLAAEIFEKHDKTNFEVFGFSIANTPVDDMQQRIAKAMDRFIDVKTMNDEETVRLCREHELDVAIDLNGYTTGNRIKLFAERVAPIQVNFIGYPGSMGMDFIDYVIADETLVPESLQKHYSEKIVYMPDTFQPCDTKAALPSKRSERSDYGLPAEGFVYCCFNIPSKITPEVFGAWMRILQRVDGSVLWLLSSDPAVTQNLRKEAEKRGVSGQRLIFGQRVSSAEHVARQQLADLFLDTLPFNAGATASLALWAGLPILTCMGQSFAGRMGASLLKTVGLPDLITTTEATYEERAIEIGSNPALAQELKQRLWRNRETAPLFNTSIYTANLEQAYRQMMERHLAGLSPDHIWVKRCESNTAATFSEREIRTNASECVL